MLSVDGNQATEDQKQEEDLLGTSRTEMLLEADDWGKKKKFPVKAWYWPLELHFALQQVFIEPLLCTRYYVRDEGHKFKKTK